MLVYWQHVDGASGSGRVDLCDRGQERITWAGINDYKILVLIMIG